MTIATEHRPVRQTTAAARPHVAKPFPGPHASLLLERQARRESSARSYPRHLPVVPDHADGTVVHDVDGNRFLDFLAGAGVLALGHSHTEVCAVAAEQLGKFSHGLDFPTKCRDDFHTRLVDRLPEGMRARAKVQFCGPTGTNAVDAALKLCKTATGRGGVVSFSGGFHGSGTAGLSITGWLGQKERVANTMPGVTFAPFSTCSDCPLGLSPLTCETNCVAWLETLLRDGHGGVEPPAAVIMELVQGEGGVNVASPDFVRRIRALTSELEIPFIVDEVQTGCGRTGTYFAFEQYGIEPDVVVLSKGLSGIGMPMAVTVYDGRLDVWGPGAHTGTFRGNQLAFAAACKTMDIIDRDDVLHNVRSRGTQLRRGLERVADQYEWVGDVRGVGLMLGVEVMARYRGSGDLARAVQRQCVERGLILEVGGRNDQVLRLLPPLNVTPDEVEQALTIIDHAVAAVDLDVTRTS